jgi:hypothetical protein
VTITPTWPERLRNKKQLACGATDHGANSARIISADVRAKHRRIDTRHGLFDRLVVGPAILTGDGTEDLLEQVVARVTMVITIAPWPVSKYPNNMPVNPSFHPT